MFNGKKVIHIVATGLCGEIGKDNKLLWSIPQELRWFKQQTLGHVVLMGRKTFDSLPKKLDRRIVLYISGNSGSKTGACGLLDGLNQASWDSNDLNTDCIYIAGGGQLYESTNQFVDEVFITKINKIYTFADTYYNMPENMKCVGVVDSFESVDRISGDEVSCVIEKWERVYE